MQYLGKTVRLSAMFLRNTGQVCGDEPLKKGVVVAQAEVAEGKYLLEIDDAAFGRWKALSTNIEVCL